MNALPNKMISRTTKLLKYETTTDYYVSKMWNDFEVSLIFDKVNYCGGPTVTKPSGYDDGIKWISRKYSIVDHLINYCFSPIPPSISWNDNDIGLFLVIFDDRSYSYSTYI